MTFSYKLNDLVIHNIPYKIVKTTPLDFESEELFSHESFKKEYVLPRCDYVPATFGVYSVEDLSISHALLPIAKRKIMKYILILIISLLITQITSHKLL